MTVLSADDLNTFLERAFPEGGGPPFTITKVGENYAEAEMTPGPSNARPGGTVSGPTLMMLADSIMYAALLAQIGPVALAVTTSLTINFLRKPELADLRVECRILKLGKALAVGDVLIFSAGKADPVAQASVTYSIPPRQT